MATKPIINIAKNFSDPSTGLTTGDAVARDPLPQGVVQAGSWVQRLRDDLYSSWFGIGQLFLFFRATRTMVFSFS